MIFLAVFLTGCFPTKKGEVNENGEKQGGEEEVYTGNMAKIMGLGIPLKCEWKKDDSYYGTSWIKGKKSFGEVYANGKTNSVIFVDNCMWSWQGDNPQGFKMCFSPEEVEVEEPVEEDESMDQVGVDQMRPPEDIDFSCRPAVFGDDKFEPPAEVNFLGMDEMMTGEGMNY